MNGDPDNEMSQPDQPLGKEKRRSKCREPWGPGVVETERSLQGPEWHQANCSLLGAQWAGWRRQGWGTDCYLAVRETLRVSHQSDTIGFTLYDSSLLAVVRGRKQAHVSGGFLSV